VPFCRALATQTPDYRLKAHGLISLRGKLPRLVTRDNGFYDPGSQERQPGQAPDVVREHRFTPGYRCTTEESGVRRHGAAPKLFREALIPRHATWRSSGVV
jgi:hypothetical protein